MAKKKTGPKGAWKWTDEVIEKLADKLLAVFHSEHSIMIMEQLCAAERLPVQYISEFSKKNKKFSEAIKEIEPAMTARLFESAYSGEGNPAIGIFALKNAGTKWKDKREEDVTHNFPTGVQVNFTTSVSDGNQS